MSKPRRHLNDELLIDRPAGQQILRPSRSVESVASSLQNPTSSSRQPVTKISKLVYDEKPKPTSVSAKSIRSFRVMEENANKKTKSNESGPPGHQMPSKANRSSRPVGKSTSERPLKTAPQDTAETNFAQKRIERQKEIDEIQGILQGLSQRQDELEAMPAIPPTSQEKNADQPCQEPRATVAVVATPATKRSNTDPELLNNRGRSTAGTNSGRRISGEVTVRSKSSTRYSSARTETSAVTTDCSAKQRSYDPTKARQFMQEQKKRRKESTAATKNATTQLDRVEIKKRLENLRKNSLAILQKNVKKAKRKTTELSPILLAGNQVQSDAARDAESQQVCKVPSVPDNDEKANSVLHKTPENQRDSKQSTSGEAVPSNSYEMPKTILPLKSVNQQLRTPSVEKTPILPSGKKIGLLRKENSETNNEMFTLEPFDFAMDKENMLQVPTPNVPSANLPPQTPKSQSIPNMMTPLSYRRTVSSELENPMPDLQLRVPDVKLRSRPAVVKKSVQAETPKKPSLPYWLQPTSVQLYPYNFIRAVRKKLEAITNPVQSGDDEKSIVSKLPVEKPTTAKGTTRNASKPDLAKTNSHNNGSGFHEFSSINLESLSSLQRTTDSSVCPPKKVAIPRENSKSQSDITSSVSINIPPSNTVSEIASLRSDIVKEPIMSSTLLSKHAQKDREKNEDDTTAPSSVFSSPEKKLPRKPVDQVNDPNDPATYSISEENADSKAATNISPLSVEKINNLNLVTKSSSTSSHTELRSREDFEQMLQDFNKSLSHVLEVNQQLQSAISKSPSRTRSIAESMKSQFSRRKPSNRSGSSVSDNYSSDFEVVASERSLANTVPIIASKETSSETIQTATSLNSIDIVRKANTTSIAESISLTAADPPSLSLITNEESTKNISVLTENFHDSIEEASKVFSKLVSSPDKPQNLTLNNESHNFSKDSLEPDRLDEIESPVKRGSRQDFVRNQINFRRGDQFVRKDRPPEVVPHQPESKVVHSDDSISLRPILNSSMGSDIFAIFNQPELEISIISQSSVVSETHLNYSSLGLYEQLIKTESTKSEHLTALLKIREKSILDRTRGQIALLEIQKEKCKAKGLTVQISIIKRKQRAILLKMEKEREEIKRILKLSTKESKVQKTFSTTHPPIPKIPDLTVSTNVSFRKCLPVSQDGLFADSRRNVLKGYELDTSQSLEVLLRDREAELQRRRSHVESLLAWHQRLDQEEEELLQMEQLLYTYNKQKQLAVSNERAHSVPDCKKQKKLMNINKSLRELQSISATTEPTTGNESENTEKMEKNFVRTSGRKLNKLWRRLTGHNDERFEPAKQYKLSKKDLEELYEDAKRTVLNDFQKTDNAVGVLNDQSTTFNNSNNSAPESNISKTEKLTDIPNLNLNFSSTATSETEKNNLDYGIDGKSFLASPSASQSPKNSSNASENQSSDTTIKTRETSEYTMNFTSSDGDVDTRLSVTVKTKLAVTSQKEDPSSADDKLVPSSQSVEICKDQHSNECTDYTTPNSDLANENDKTSSNNSSSTIESEIKLSDDIDTSNRASELQNSRSETSVANTIDKSSEETSTNVNISSYLVLHNGYAQIPSCHNDSLDKNDVSDIMIDEITAPKFETTVDDTTSIAEEFIFTGSPDKEVSNAANSGRSSDLDRFELPDDDDEDRPPSELERRLIDIDESLKELNSSFERVLSPERSTRSSQTEVDGKSTDFGADDNKENRPKESNVTKMTVKDYLLNPDVTSTLMPDIINEVELRRRQQILVESDIIQLENAVPFALLREIPNKPPPPYVPPAHGSPMTTIFPSEDRIKEITFRRTNELYQELQGISLAGPSILDENITNIYERIILDICKECVRDYQPTFSSNSAHVDSYKMPLALYNPPDRQKCVQDFVYKRVRKLLNMDKQKPRPNSVFSLGRRKRDHVDEMLVQELFEEEHKWNNFDLEETEVRDSVIDEVFDELVKDLIDDFEESYKHRREDEGETMHEDSIG